MHVLQYCSIPVVILLRYLQYLYGIYCAIYAAVVTGTRQLHGLYGARKGPADSGSRTSLRDASDSAAAGLRVMSRAAPNEYAARDFMPSATRPVLASLPSSCPCSSCFAQVSSRRYVRSRTHWSFRPRDTPRASHSDRLAVHGRMCSQRCRSGQIGRAHV